MSQDLTNNVIARYVVHHKQLERRMDGSSGGAFGALLETLVKDSYYFCGTIADKNLSAKHIVSNNPDDIVSLSGYQPTESNFAEAFSQILGLLKRGEKVEVLALGRDIPYISDEKEMAELYAKSACFVTPSLQDNLPNTIMEAMACGTPCVGFNVGGQVSVISALGENLIVKVKESRVAVSDELAKKIMV